MEASPATPSSSFRSVQQAVASLFYRLPDDVLIMIQDRVGKPCTRQLAPLMSTCKHQFEMALKRYRSQISIAHGMFGHVSARLTLFRRLGMLHCIRNVCSSSCTLELLEFPFLRTLSTGFEVGSQLRGLAQLPCIPHLRELQLFATGTRYQPVSDDRKQRLLCNEDLGPQLALILGRCANLERLTLGLSMMEPSCISAKMRRELAPCISAGMDLRQKLRRDLGLPPQQMGISLELHHHSNQIPNFEGLQKLATDACCEAAFDRLRSVSAKRRSNQDAPAGDGDGKKAGDGDSDNSDNNNKKQRLV